MACVRSIVKLPDAEITDSKQRKAVWYRQLKAKFDRLLTELVKDHPSLNDKHVMDIWRSRSGRSIAEQEAKCLAMCRRLKRCLRIVERREITGNAYERDLMRCAIGFYNEFITVSHCYHVVRNPNYVTGKDFPYPKSFNWLNIHTNELNPTVTLDDADNTETKSDRINIDQDEEKSAKIYDDKEDGSERVEAVDHSKKKSLEQKAAKAAKNLTRVHDADDMVTSTVISSLSDKLEEIGSATIAAAQYRSSENKDKAKRDFELQKAADELEAVKFLFNNGNEESQLYKKKLKRKGL